MADSMIQDAFNLANRYKSYNPTVTDDPTINYWGEKEKYDKLYEDKSSLSFTDLGAHLAHGLHTAHLN